jgi:flagellar biosynthesis protein FliR
MTMIDLDAAPATVVSFFFILARLGGLVVFAPFFSSFAVPPTIRIGLTLALGLALFPALAPRLPAVPEDPVMLILLLGGELIIGMVLGVVGQIFFAVLQVAGQLISFQMGFAIINIIDPQTQTQFSVIGVLQNLVGMVVFISVDAHHWYIEVICHSYKIALPLDAGRWDALLGELMRLSSQIFVVGFKLAAPLALVLLIVDLLLGLIGRAAPQIQILLLGLPLKNLVGLLLLLGGFNVFLPFMIRYINQLHTDLFRVAEILTR